jgi:hypothetical protein
MNLCYAPKRRRATTISLVAVVGLALIFVPEPADAKGRSKVAAHEDGTSGQAHAKGKAKTKKSKGHHRSHPGQVVTKRKGKSRKTGGEEKLVHSILPAVADAPPAAVAQGEAQETTGMEPAAEKVTAPEASERHAVESEAGDRQIAQVRPHQAADSEASEPRASGRDATVRERPPEGGATWPIYALGGVGLLGVGGYAALTWKGRQDNNTLRTSCAPDCNPASVHHIRMIYLAADVSMGVGVVALIASTWLYLRSPSTEAKASTHVAQIRALDLQATPSGAVATLGGTF